MNDDLNFDERHEIDDLFRDALNDYSESPSGDLWKKLNRRLNWKEIVNFITFKKVRGADHVVIRSLPVYRQQWFRISVAAAIALLLLFTSLIIVNRSVNNAGGSSEMADHNGAKPPLYKNPAGIDNYYHAQNRNIIASDTPFPGKENEKYYAEKNDRNNSLNKMPNVENEKNNLNPKNNENYANDLKQKDKSRKKDNQNTDQNNTTNNPKNFVPDNNNTLNNNQGPVVADNNNNNNGPIVVSNERKADSARDEELKKADSLINANKLKDTTEQQAVEREQANDILRDTTAENVVTDQVTDVNKNNTYELVVPNVFTPNGDGLNDYFYITNLEYYPENTLIIQDRKGKIIYRKKEYRNDWNGVNVPDVTYFYILTYRNTNNENITLKGVVYIIR